MFPFLQGMLIGAGLIIAIGAQNAFVLSQGVKKQYIWMVAIICSVCDAVLMFAGAAGVGTFVVKNPGLQLIAAWGGALFLFWYGLKAARSAFKANALRVNDAGVRSRRAVVFATLAVTLLNPHVYLDTLVLVGSMSGQFEENGRFLFAGGAASASILWFLLLSFGGILLAPLFSRPIAWRVLDAFVCLTMWTIGFQLLPVSSP